jgi:hypothetical protein
MEKVNKFYELVNMLIELAENPYVKEVKEEVEAARDLAAELQAHYVVIRKVGPGTEDFAEKYQPMISGTCDYLFENYGLNCMLICEHEKNYAIASRMDPKHIYMSLFAIVKNIPQVYEMLKKDLASHGINLKGNSK